MLTEKEFKKHVFSLIGEHPYTWAKNKGIKRGVIDQLKREKIPGPKILNQLANALETDVNYLLTGKKTVESYDEDSIESLESGPGIDDASLIKKHEETVIKLIEILEGTNRHNAKAIIASINALYITKDITGPGTSLSDSAYLRSLNHKQWVMAGKPERRKEQECCEMDRRQIA